MVALRDGVLNKRIPRAKIKQIILIDAWWHDKQRRLLDLARLRRIFDELDQFIFEDDRSWRYRKISPNLEGGLIDPGDSSLLDIFDQVLHPGRQTRRACLDGGSNDLGICPGKIRRAHRVDELSRIESKLQLGFVVDLGLIDKLGQLLRIR